MCTKFVLNSYTFMEVFVMIADYLRENMYLLQILLVFLLYLYYNNIPVCAFTAQPQS